MQRRRVIGAPDFQECPRFARFIARFLLRVRKRRRKKAERDNGDGFKGGGARAFRMRFFPMPFFLCCASCKVDCVLNCTYRARTLYKVHGSPIGRLFDGRRADPRACRLAGAGSCPRPLVSLSLSLSFSRLLFSRPDF